MKNTGKVDAASESVPELEADVKNEGWNVPEGQAEAIGASSTEDVKYAGQQVSGEVENRDDDALWKEFLSRHFHYMLRSVLPKMAEAVDTKRPVRFLDTELRRLARFTRRYSESPPDSRRFVDILAEVPLLSGEDAWILLHVEVQGRGGKENFPLRMHRYRCLLEGRYNRPVAGLAILVQPIPADQIEGVYDWSMFGSRVLYEYPVFRIYEGDEEKLRESDNPFDLAHYAGMQAWKQRSDDSRKLGYMKTLLGELNKRGWNHEEKIALLWFLEGVMHIEDEQVWDEWEKELESRKEAGNMYVSLMERKGIKKNKIKTARKMLKRGMDIPTIVDLTELPEEEVRELAEESED